MATDQLVSTILKVLPAFFRANGVTRVDITASRKRKGKLLLLHLSALPVANSVLLDVAYVGKVKRRIPLGGHENDSPKPMAALNSTFDFILSPHVAIVVAAATVRHEIRGDEHQQR